jgi:hypothetical protein
MEDCLDIRFGVTLWLYCSLATNAFSQPNKCVDILSNFPRLNVTEQRENLKEFILINQNYFRRALDSDGRSLESKLSKFLAADPEHKNYLQTAKSTLVSIQEGFDPGLRPESRDDINYNLRNRAYQLVLQNVASISGSNYNTRAQAELFYLDFSHFSAADSLELRRFILLRAIHEPTIVNAEHSKWFKAIEENFTGDYTRLSDSELEHLKSFLEAKTQNSPTAKSAENIILWFVAWRGLSPKQTADLLAYGNRLGDATLVGTVLDQMVNFHDPVVHEAVTALLKSRSSEIRAFANEKLLEVGDEAVVTKLLRKVAASKKPEKHLHQLTEVAPPQRLTAEQRDELLWIYINRIQKSTDPETFWLINWDYISWKPFISPEYRQEISRRMLEALETNPMLAPVALRAGQILDSRELVKLAFKQSELYLLETKAFVQTEPELLTSTEKNIALSMALRVLERAESERSVYSVLNHLFYEWKGHMLDDDQQYDLSMVFRAVSRKYESLNYMDNMLADFLMDE